MCKTPVNSGGFLISLFPVFSFVLLSFLDHSLNVSPGQAAPVIGDGDLVLLLCTFIHSRNMEDAIGINVNSDFLLRNTTGYTSCAYDFRFSKQVVVLAWLILAFSSVALKQSCGTPTKAASWMCDLSSLASLRPFYRVLGAMQQASILLFKSSMGNGGIEVSFLTERIHVNPSLGVRGEDILSPCMSSVQRWGVL